MNDDIKNPNDFIILNGVHGRCPTVKCSEDCQQSNIDYWKNFTVEHVVDGDIDIGCFGCSFTYGSHLKYEDTWPALLQKTLGMKTANFGVPGGGVDACLINLKNCFEKYKIKTAVILLPQFDRKLCSFEKEGNYFQMPVAPNTEWHYGDNVASNFFDSAFILQQIKRTKKHIVMHANKQFQQEVVDVGTKANTIVARLVPIKGETKNKQVYDYSVHPSNSEFIIYFLTYEFVVWD